MTKFFDTETPIPAQATSFKEFGLSPQILKSLKNIQFETPTPIQSSMIPIALQGRDICASAVTGSGKTAAFLIPTIERLLRHKISSPTTRSIILSPTRELATQTFSVLNQFIQYTKLTALLVTGGTIRPQDEESKILTFPDFIVATPGRLVDHIKNCPDFTLKSVSVLILDEADRLLEEGFQTQIEEIVHNLPSERQALLVTATMTSSVSRLAELALQNPVKIALDELFMVSEGLSQEFIKVTNENRDASLIALCSRVCESKTVIFFSTKKAAHRMFLIFKALGMSAAELHGDMSQIRRYEALATFANGSASFLMASDVAARGLDIKGVENVINYNMPKQMSHYIHRVGRTARIGSEGRSIAFIDEGDKEMMKSIITNSKNPIHKRTIPDAVLETTQAKIDAVREAVRADMENEKETRQLEMAEKALERAKEIAVNPNSAKQEKEKRIYVSKEKRKPKDASRVASKIQRIKRRSARFHQKAKA